MGGQRKRWYEPEGLRFSCLDDCSLCCGGDAGHVLMTDEEQTAIAGFLGLTEEDFRRRYCRRVGQHLSFDQCMSGIAYSLNERGNGDCVFLDADGKCAVYEVRPRQCSSYPFWKDVLVSRVRWEREALECPGINQGRLYSPEEIRLLLGEVEADK